jgi:pilus assembly protein CpaE
MSQASSTIVVTTDDSVMEALRAAFDDDPVLTPLVPCRSMDELEHRLTLVPRGLVIIDLAPGPAEILESIASLVSSHPDVRFVVVAPEFDKQLLVESQNKGAKHFVPKAWIGPDIVPVCRELASEGVPEGEDAPRGGAIYTVIAASGGCGATTFAVNLAAEMAVIRDARSLVVDFDTRFGGVATYLGVKGEYGLADLLNREQPPDKDLVRSTAIERGRWVDLLISPATVNFKDPAPLYFDGIDGILRVLRSGYPNSVLDATSLPFEAASLLADRSNASVILLELTVKDLHNTRLMLDALRGEEGARSPVYLVANRVQGAGKPITLREAAETLEFDGDIFALPDDPKCAMDGLNAGLPLIESSMKSKLRKQIEAFAMSLEPEAEEEAEPARRGKRRWAA